MKLITRIVECLTLMLLASVFLAEEAPQAQEGAPAAVQIAKQAQEAAPPPAQIATKAAAPAQLTLGAVGVMGGFRSDLRDGNGTLVYLKEADGLRAASKDFKSFAFGIPGDSAVMKELCVGLHSRDFTHLRGIIMGGPETDLSNPAVKKAAQANLIAKFRLGLANDIKQFFTVAQSWPAGETGADFYAVVAPSIIENSVAALKAVPEVKEFGFEFLIKAEQEHVYSLARTLYIVRQINAQLGEQRAFPVPDLAHMLGLVPRAHWPDIMDQLAAACIAGEVRYAHFSIPETRTDKFVEASKEDNLPVKEFCAALARSPHPIVVDLEAFNPGDQDLGLLRDRVQRFKTADPSGWKDGTHFERFASGSQFFRKHYYEAN